MAKKKFIDDRIRDLLYEGPLVGFYFGVAVTVLKEHIEQIPDEELGKMFENLLHPQRIRNNIGEMHKRLHNTE